MTTCAYVTLSDGTLVDVELADEIVTIRAGADLLPSARPIVCTLARDDARTVARAIGDVVERRRVEADAQTIDVNALLDDLRDGRRAPLELVLRPAVALQLAALLQLALRHPAIHDHRDSARTARTVIDHVRAYFGDAPIVVRVLDEGDR